VNVEHLRAFLWLRWRLLMNQLNRGGLANAVLLMLLGVGLALFAFVGFFAAILVGSVTLQGVSPTTILYVWDGLVVVFLFLWSAGLIAELQRSEALSLEKFLHLPVSLTGVFLINYLSSLLSLNLMVFVPIMVGLVLGLVFAWGPGMLALLPLLAAFFLAVTALTYQLQGWLAALMVNKRRRRTVLVVVTGLFVLLIQAPQLLNIIRPWQGPADDWGRLVAEQTKLTDELSAGRITLAQYQKLDKELQEKHRAENKERDRQASQHMEGMARFLNLVLPPGWLPLGALSAAEGNFIPPLLGTLGLTLIGAASLWRSYRTTVRLYTGQFTSGARRPLVAAPTAPPGKLPARSLLEWHIPGVPEQAQAVALAIFRSLTRAPEVKMLLLTPLTLAVIFGSTLLARSFELPLLVRPLLAFAALGMVLFSLVQLVSNQFGFDRNGFRVFVLCAAPRRDILLGKNLAVAPLALALAALMIGVLQVFHPLRLDHLLAVVPQAISMFLVFCVLANLVSILAPLPFAAGTLKPANPRLIPILFQMGLTMLLPLLLAPTLLPLGLEFALAELGWVQGIPLHLLLSLLECALVVYLYRLLLGWEGELLYAREQKILETVVTKAE
jgi:ABC-2 type transport system permease protein